MPLTPDDAPLPAYSPSDKLRHDLKSPLTTIHARAQLLVRAVRRSPSLADEERARLLAGLTEIEATVREVVSVIDAMSDESSEPGGDSQP